MNRHSARAVAVQDPDKINLLSQLNASVMGGSGDPLYGAPTVIVVMADSPVPTYIEDASLAIGNMLNAAYRSVSAHAGFTVRRRKWRPPRASGS